MIRIDFNADAISARLDRASRQLDDLEPLYQEIGEYMTRATRERFREGEAPDGSRWQPKKPATIERYRSKEKRKPAIRDLLSAHRVGSVVRSTISLPARASR